MEAILTSNSILEEELDKSRDIKKEQGSILGGWSINRKNNDLLARKGRLQHPVTGAKYAESTYLGSSFKVSLPRPTNPTVESEENGRPLGQ